MLTFMTSEAPSPTSDAGIEQLWDDFATRLRAFIASRVSNPADVDDLLQEVFIKVQRSAGQLRDEPGHPGADAQFDDPSRVRAEISACLRPLVDELPDPYRQALELVELDGTSQTEAARIVGLSVSGMKSRVQRARTLVFERLSALCALTIDARGGPIDCVPAPGGPCS